ncbi:MAG TPA: DUF1684 domain-containing protein [Chitinophagaceae bacterium]|nr:DUF1684 domain-containing protein [Chitinophagaceae bacterium]
MRIYPVIAFFCCLPVLAQSQSSYGDSLLLYQKQYVDTHEVVKDGDRRYISFYPVNKEYCVIASFEKLNSTNVFTMTTSSGKEKKYLKYGLVKFRIHDTLQQLYIYQSIDLMKQKKYKDYLFIPFGDATSGFTSYGGGRYMDFVIDDIKEGYLTVDFNKAYNPYCAYTAGYNCPIPPSENILKVAITAGEKNYSKPVHQNFH